MVVVGSYEWRTQGECKSGQHPQIKEKIRSWVSGRSYKKESNSSHLEVDDSQALFRAQDTGNEKVQEKLRVLKGHWAQAVLESHLTR